MAARTCEELVNLTRERIGVWDRSALRDGFDADDLGTADHAIRPHLSAYYRSLIPTGFVKCEFSQSVVAGSGEYTLDSRIGTVIWATFSGVPLAKRRGTELDAMTRGRWRTRAPGVPRVYTNDLPRQIRLVPPPLLSDASGVASLVLLAETEPGELVGRGDVPLDLFNGYHDELAAGAGVRVLTAMLGDPRLPADLRAAVPAKVELLRPDARRLEEWVQALAQAREEGEVRQMRPLESREGGEAGVWGVGAFPGWGY